MNPQPTGQLREQQGRHRLVLTREFRGSAADVWASVTEPERLARWIGTWRGDPASGRVDFFMTAESEDASASPCQILACREPELLHVAIDDAAGAWELILELAEVHGVTTLTFTHVLAAKEGVGELGPGWEYYLDRLTAAHFRADVSAIEWDDYFPAQQEYYAAL